MTCSGLVLFRPDLGLWLLKLSRRGKRLFIGLEKKAGLTKMLQQQDDTAQQMFPFPRRGKDLSEAPPLWQTQSSLLVAVRKGRLQRLPGRLIALRGRRTRGKFYFYHSPGIQHLLPGIFIPWSMYLISLSKQHDNT